ncbi:MAG: hypothetical protein ACFFAN_12240 [Promethearchaeota archaeon]
MNKISLAENEEILYKCRDSLKTYGLLFAFTIAQFFIVFVLLFMYNLQIFILFFGFFIIIASSVMIFVSLNSLLTRTTITSIRIIQIKRKKFFIKRIKKEIKITNILFLKNSTYYLNIVPQSENIQDLTNLIHLSYCIKYQMEVGYICINGKNNTYKIIEILKKIILLIPHPTYDYLLLNRQITGDF